MPRGKRRKSQGPSLVFESEKVKAAPLSQDDPEVLGDVDSPDIVRSKDLKVIAVRGDQLRRLGKALPLCWLPGDPSGG